MLRRRTLVTMRIIAVGAALVLASAGVAGARQLRNTLRTAPRLIGVNELSNERYQNAVDALLETGIRNLPIHPTSGAAYTYVYDPSCGCYKQTPTASGPWFLVERAEPVGWGLTTVSLTLAEYNLRDAHGCTFGDDRQPFDLSSGLVRYRAGTELIYGVATLGIVHGITENLEVSTAIPIGWIDFGVNASVRGDGFASAGQHFHVGPNIMDMLVRLKYRILTSGPFTVSVGGRARIPTGHAADGLGTGHGELGPFLLASGVFANGMLGTYADLGFDAVVTDAHRSSGHYGLGFSLQAPFGTWWHNIAFTGELYGRSEIDGIRDARSVSGPHAGGNCPYLCLDPSRQDYFDATMGIRVRVVRSLVVSVGVFKPINDDHGVRPSGWSPVGAIEATF